VRKPRRLAAIAVIAVTSLLVGVGVSSRMVGHAMLLSDGELLGHDGDDVGPPKDSSPLATFRPAVRGAPTWVAVTYSDSNGQCLDLNAEWGGELVGSLGGCGFGDDVDEALRVLGADPSVNRQRLIAQTNLSTPLVLAEGAVGAPDASEQYGVVGGLVGCDCTVTARWADGSVASAKAVNGLFLIQREPAAVGGSAADGHNSVISV
jgi:hypothetical protein